MRGNRSFVLFSGLAYIYGRIGIVPLPELSGADLRVADLESANSMLILSYSVVA
jgi:hypothetical protein